MSAKVNDMLDQVDELTESETQDLLIYCIRQLTLPQVIAGIKLAVDPDDQEEIAFQLTKIPRPDPFKGYSRKRGESNI